MPDDTVIPLLNLLSLNYPWMQLVSLSLYHLMRKQEAMTLMCQASVYHHNAQEMSKAKEPTLRRNLWSLR